jgi:hypothetical protein
VRARRNVRSIDVARDTWTMPMAVALIMGISLLAGMVGADARWLAALGHDIVASGHIPAGVPFAAAPTVHWHNATVLAELIFWALETISGDRGLVIAQAVAVAIAFVALGLGAVRAGAGQQAAASTCLIAAVGVAPSLAIARVQLFSLALFPVLLLLLRDDARTPSRRAWLVVPLIALWSNLHGAVLAGLLVTLVYLAAARLRVRPGETIALAVACLAALCANPAGVQAVSYYAGVLSNAAAQRGDGMWGPLSPTAPADALLIVAGAVLAVKARRGRPAMWEVLAMSILAAMTIHASRSGVWLLFLLVTPAARGTRQGSPWRQRGVVVGVIAAVSLVAGVLRGPAQAGADHVTVARAISLAGGTPILASDIAAEQVALGGGMVWASNPIDAFGHRVQVAYLEWMAGDTAGLDVLQGSIRVVLVDRESRAADLMERVPGFRLVRRTQRFEILARGAASGATNG